MLEPNIQISGWRGGDGDASYLDKTLLHSPMEIGLDEPVSGAVFRRFWGRAASVAGAWFVFFAFLWLLTGGATTETTGFYGETTGPDFTLLNLAFWGAFIIYWVIFLFSELQ